MNEMRRRGFLGAILAAGMAPAFVSAKVLMPVRQIILPETAAFETVNSLLRLNPSSLITIQMITNEALRVLNDNLAFSESVNRQYALPLVSEELSLTTRQFQGAISVRRPQRLGHV